MSHHVHIHPDEEDETDEQKPRHVLLFWGHALGQMQTICYSSLHTRLKQQEIQFDRLLMKYYKIWAIILSIYSLYAICYPNIGILIYAKFLCNFIVFQNVFKHFLFLFFCDQSPPQKKCVSFAIKILINMNSHKFLVCSIGIWQLVALFMSSCNCEFPELNISTALILDQTKVWELIFNNSQSNSNGPLI